MKKILALLLSIIFIFSLAACGDNPADNKETPDYEEQQTDESIEDEQKESKKQNKEKNKPKEFNASAWVKDNTLISFYLMYSESKPEINQHLTLKILDGKAVLYSKKGEGEEQPITIYKETDEGIVTTQLLYIGDAKGALVDLPKADYHDIKEFLPETGNVMMTFGARADNDIYKNKEFTGKTEYIGRKCDVIEKKSGISTQTTYLDSESGIVLKYETVTKLNGTETRVVHCYVTALEYGKVTENDVNIDLSHFKVTYEEPEAAPENTEENKQDEEKDEESEYISWPDNEFTKLVPAPEIEAKVLKADTIGKMFTIDVEWTLDEGAVYAQQLAEAGFGDDCAEKFSKHGYIDRTENGVNVQLLEIGGKVNVSIMPVEE